MNGECIKRMVIRNNMNLHDILTEDELKRLLFLKDRMDFYNDKTLFWLFVNVFMIQFVASFFIEIQFHPSFIITMFASPVFMIVSACNIYYNWYQEKMKAIKCYYDYYDVLSKKYDLTY